MATRLYTFLICTSILNYPTKAGKFDYGLFENFKVTRIIFQDEQKLVKTLHSVKTELAKQKHILNNNMKYIKEGGNSEDLKKIKGSKKKVKKIFHEIRTYEKEFPKNNSLEDYYLSLIHI